MKKLFVVLATSAMLSACLSSDKKESTQAVATSSNVLIQDERPARQKVPLGLGCAWQITSDPNLVNIAYPDEFAQYWVSLLPNVPQTRLRIDGRYGQMRYLSFNAYDSFLRPITSIADISIEPNNGLGNPFLDERAAAGGTYTLYVEFTEKPDVPAKNTLYTGASQTNQGSVPNPLGFGLMYRSYVPKEGLDFDGGVGLPHLTYENLVTGEDIFVFPDCDVTSIPRLGGVLPDLPINELLLRLSFLDPLLAIANLPAAVNPPKTHVFYDMPETYIEHVAANLGIARESIPISQTPLSGTGGFLSNQDNAYTTTIFSRNLGNVAIMRAKAPTWRGKAGVPFNSEQVRYYSICSNEFLSQRFVGCLHDDRIPLDDEGFFTVMISDDFNRPAWVSADKQIGWLPWGPYPDTLIYFRHMLPNNSFKEAIHNVPQGTPAEAVMGDFFPVGAYCSQLTLSTEPTSPQQLFESCLNETKARGAASGILPAFNLGKLLLER